MEIAVMTGLPAKGDMDVNARQLIFKFITLDLNLHEQQNKTDRPLLDRYPMPVVLQHYSFFAVPATHTIYQQR